MGEISTELDLPDFSHTKYIRYLDIIKVYLVVPGPTILSRQCFYLLLGAVIVALQLEVRVRAMHNVKCDDSK